MPYFHLLPFVITEQCGEGEMIRVVIFVSVNHLFEFLLFTYSLSSGI